MRRVSTLAFILAGIAAAIALVVFIAPNANANPDGLERVAADTGFDTDATDHALADGPLADYGVDGVGNRYIATWIAGIGGVAVTFVFGAGIVYLARRTRGSPDQPATPATTASGG